MKTVYLLALLSIFCLSGCLEEEDTGADQEEFEYLQEEKALLKEDLEKAYLELDEYDLKFETYGELEEKARSADEKDAQLEELRKSKEETEEQMRELRKEFDTYQKKYEANVRGKGRGEKFATIQVGGRTLEAVEISAISETEVKVKHSSGFATLDAATAPPEWKKRFFLRSEEEVAERERELALFLNPPSEPNDLANEGEPDQPVSESKQRRIDKEKEYDELATLEGRVSGGLVSISGSGGKGSGFFVQDGITTYLYTTANVLDGNNTLKIVDASGREWKKFGELEVARGMNLVRLAVAEPVEHLLEVRPGGEAPALGVAVVALGFVGEGGTLQKAVGKLRKVDSTIYETSASLTKAGSGSPMMTSDGLVMAILTEPATVREDVWKRGPSSRSRSRSRLFASRLDVGIVWDKISLGRFIGARDTLERFDRVTRLLQTLADLPPEPEGFRLQAKAGGTQTVRDVLQDNRQLNVVTRILELDRELTEKGLRISERDWKRKYRSVYSAAQLNAAEQSLNTAIFSPYHLPDAEVSARARSEARKELEKVIRSLSE